MTSTKNKTRKVPRPTVLVLEGLSGTARCVEQAGGATLTLSPRSGLDDIIAAFNEDAVDALVLTGGGDVDPRRYGRQPHRATYGVSEDRDFVELSALNYALAWKVPVLGICRGAQIMNVQAGGTLYQNIPDKLGGSHRHRNGLDMVAFLPDSLAAHAVGLPAASVTHLHHQAIQKIGTDYRASAWHRDGTIEAIESTDGTWRVGAQFHPEFAPRSAPERGLFRDLVVHAARYAKLPVPPMPRPRAAKPRVVKASAWTESAPAHRLPRNGEQYGVSSHWRCFRCQIDFDLRLDYVDHMWELHEVDLERPAILEPFTNHLGD